MGPGIGPDRLRPRRRLSYRRGRSRPTVAIYRGTDGWHARAIGALAADVKWPFIGPAFGGLQRLVPRVQLVLTPPTDESRHPQ